MNTHSETHRLWSLIELLKSERDEAREQLQAMREAVNEARIEINCALRISRLALRVCPYESGVDLVVSRIKATLAKLQPFIKP